MMRLVGGILMVVVLLLGSTAADDHPVYLSKAEVDYDTKADRLEIALELFPDDLSEAISEQEGRVIEIGTAREDKAATTYIEAYLKDHFQFTVNGKYKAFRYLGREIGEKQLTSLWVYLEVPNVHRLKSLVLKNSILTNYKEEQRNYVYFRENKAGQYTRKVATKGGEELVLK